MIARRRDRPDFQPASIGPMRNIARNSSLDAAATQGSAWRQTTLECRHNAQSRRRSWQCSTRRIRPWPSIIQSHVSPGNPTERSGPNAVCVEPRKATVQTSGRAMDVRLTKVNAPDAICVKLQPRGDRCPRLTSECVRNWRLCWKWPVASWNGGDHDTGRSLHARRIGYRRPANCRGIQAYRVSRAVPPDSAPACPPNPGRLRNAR